MDYYSVLGVPEDADLNLIKATFRALLKIYHPDVYKGDKTFAKQKMQEINEAYKTLSDPKKRKSYDKENQNSSNNHFDTSFDHDELRRYEEQIQSDWKFALEYYPEVDDLFKSLDRISSKLGFQFKIICVETKSFAKASSVAKKIEDDFFFKYFGSSERLHMLVKTCLLKGEVALAKEANKAIVVLGDSAADRVIESLNEALTDKPHNPADGAYRSYAYAKDPDTNNLRIISQPGDDAIKSAIGLEFSNKDQLRFFVDNRISEIQRDRGW